MTRTVFVSFLVVVSCATPLSTRLPPEVHAARLLAASTLIEQGEPLALRAPLFTAAKGDLREVYRKVAPATVLVRTGNGFGTGALIDARGFVLTNHHVIASAESVDFKRRVQVERGHLRENGVMELDGAPLTGWVLKSDPLLDLAIIKLDAPPADLKALRVSRSDPVPGEPVSALGNGSIGLLWAIKDGEISSIGKLATHLALLAGTECRVAAGEDPAPCRASSRSVDVERERLERQVPALVIQSTCTISPGDSGGPLVNRAGELVGVNAFLRSDAHAPVSANFHVHVAEVRAFLKAVPTEPLAVVPSPFEQVGTGDWLDADGDGHDDTWLSTAGERTTLLVKLGSPDASLLTADLAIKREKGELLAWYDVDGDGLMDRLVRGERAWRLNHETELGSFLGAAKPMDPSNFTDARRARLEAMRPALELALGLGTANTISDVPSLTAPLVGAPRALDLNRDGRPDALSGRTLEATQVLLNPTGFDKAAWARGSEVMVLSRGRLRWVAVTAPERAVLFGLETTGDFVTHAWALTPREPGEPLPDYFGRDVGSAASELLSNDVRAQLGALLGTPVRAVRRRLPDFSSELEPSATVERVDVTGLEQAVTSRRGRTANALQFSLTAKPDFVWFARNGWSWTAADLDSDGEFDVVTVKLGAKVVRWVGATRREGGRLVSPALFAGDARGSALKKLAPLFFPSDDIGD